MYKNSIGCLLDNLLIFFACHSDNLLILLVVGFDDLSYCQENICSKFNAFILATCTIANSKQNFYTYNAHDAIKF